MSNPLDAPINIADDVAALEDTLRGLAIPAQFVARVAEEDQSLLERLYTGLPSLELLYLPAPFRFFAERQLPAGLSAAQQTHGAAVLRFFTDFTEESHTGWVNQLDSLLRGAGEAMGVAIARYAAELPSIEAWLDWAYDHEPCTDARPRG